jgi:hypothetical protein
MKFLILTFAVVVAGCDAQQHSEQLASLNQRVTALEGRMSSLQQAVQKQQEAPDHWVLWEVSEAPNGGYPAALSGYSSKAECMADAGSWKWPGSSSTIVSQDPVIYQLKAYRVRMECLPIGVTPYSH